MDQILSMITRYGVEVFVIAYFIYKDNKFNKEMLTLMGSVAELLRNVAEELKEDRK